MNKRQKTRKPDSDLVDLINGASRVSTAMNKRAKALHEIVETLLIWRSNFTVEDSALGIFAEDERRYTAVCDTMCDMQPDPAMDIIGFCSPISIGTEDLEVEALEDNWALTFALLRCIPRSKPFDKLLMKFIGYCKRGFKDEPSEKFCDCIDAVKAEIAKSQVSVRIRALSAGMK